MTGHSWASNPWVWVLSFRRFEPVDNTLAARPIIFSPLMVRALLAGTKQQTRRAFKIQPLGILKDGSTVVTRRLVGKRAWFGLMARNPNRVVAFPCRFGEVGDRLWVRENDWEPSEPTAQQRRNGAGSWPAYCYDADGITPTDAGKFKAWGWKRRPSMFMPRWACRIMLELQDIRIERLHCITEADAIAEGIVREALPPDPDNFHPPGSYGYVSGVHPYPKGAIYPTAVRAYQELWQHLNG